MDSKILVVVIGLIFLAIGAAGISGKWKSWYWNSRRMAFASFPGGVLFVLEGVRQAVTDGTPISWVLKGGEVFALAIVVWWVLRPPKMIMPTWIRTVEAHPREVYDLMSISIKNKEEWRSKVATNEALKDWIAAIEKTLKMAKKKKK